MKRIVGFLLWLGSSILIGCSSVPAAAGDKAGPVIDSIKTSNNSFSIDCPPTSVAVTAHITDPSGISSVQLRYRVGSDKPYISLGMGGGNGNEFSATLKGSALPPDSYGAWEFYITAEDEAGNSTRSATDSSVQFLPCVSH
jgi:hypothetical protein